MNAPAIDCGCHPTAVGSQFISGGAGKAECLARGKKGSKGSTWKLSCDGQPTKARFQNRSNIDSYAESEHFDLKLEKVKTVSMGKNCMLQDDLYCGVGVPPVTHHCGCPNEVAMFKDVKCVGDNVYSCTGMS